MPLDRTTRCRHSATVVFIASAPELRAIDSRVGIAAVAQLVTAVGCRY